MTAPEPHITRETPIGTPVVFDIAPYPQGYAWGAEPTGETARGTLYAVEGDAGIAWCFVQVDPHDRGDGGEYHHVPMDRVRVRYAVQHDGQSWRVLHAGVVMDGESHATFEAAATACERLADAARREVTPAPKDTDTD